MTPSQYGDNQNCHIIWCVLGVNLFVYDRDNKIGVGSGTAVLCVTSHSQTDTMLVAHNLSSTFLKLVNFDFSLLYSTTPPSNTTHVKSVDLTGVCNREWDTQNNFYQPPTKFQYKGHNQCLILLYYHYIMVTPLCSFYEITCTTHWWNIVLCVL